MTLGIPLYYTNLSVSNTTRIIEVFGVDQAQSIVHNWTHDTERQPDTRHSPDHVAAGVAVSQLAGDQYWLSAVVDPASNELPHKKTGTGRNVVLTNQFVRGVEGDSRSPTPCSSSVVITH